MALSDLSDELLLEIFRSEENYARLAKRTGLDAYEISRIRQRRGAYGTRLRSIGVLDSERQPRSRNYSKKRIADHLRQAVFAAKGLYPDIARRFNVSVSTVSRCKRDAGLAATTSPSEKGQANLSVWVSFPAHGDALVIHSDPSPLPKLPDAERVSLEALTDSIATILALTSQKVQFGQGSEPSSEDS